MEYKKLGNTGLKVSPLCMGTMQFGWSVGEEDSHRILSATFDAGINFLILLTFIRAGWMATRAAFQKPSLEAG